jgi:hypothetical protein
MLRQEVEALLKMECGDNFELLLRPVLLSRGQLTRPAKFDWYCSRSRYWIGQLDTSMGYIVTSHYHTTNHQAASELYKEHITWKS